VRHGSTLAPHIPSCFSLVFHFSTLLLTAPSSFWANQTFQDPSGTVTTHTAADVLKHFHEDLHMRFGGIRKPRTYSNLDLSKSNGWLLPDADGVGAGNNNWNYTVESVCGTGGAGCGERLDF
jgi:hypothetical protein